MLYISISMNGRHLTVSIAAIPRLVTISRFDVVGRLISKLFEKRLDQGIHNINLESIHCNYGMSVLRISIDSITYNIGIMDLGKSTKTSVASIKNNTERGFSKKANVSSNTFPETLLLTKNGFLDKRITVKNQDEILGNLRLYDTTFASSTSNFPKLDGSTTNVPLARIICCKFSNTSYTWQQVKRTYPVNYNYEVVPDSTNKAIYNHIMSVSSFSKTPQSYDSLIAGKRDLILVASAPSLRHLEAARTAGLDFDIWPFAVDALLMVVNKNSTITGITTQNIKDIYTGTVTNWNQIGGPDLNLTAFQREETSGSQELIKTLVMKNTPIDPSIELLRGMMTVFDELHIYTNAISYTPYYYKEYQMRDSLICSIKINAIIPDRNSIYSREYPLCAEVLVVSLTNLSNTTQAAKLRDWLLAPQGQKVVNESGYVPVREPK